MPTIVQELTNGTRYVLIGVAATKHATGQIWGRLKFNKESKRLVCAADEQGTLHWFESRHVRVVTVDGVATGDVLG
ncbi:MAG: hypothetical protein ACI89L_001529 [Phycisphaerales bacterium]|jgi:hypothetical protein